MSNSWAVRCIWCHAEPNHSCRTSDGQLRVAHKARARMARAVIRPAPTQVHATTEPDGGAVGQFNDLVPVGSEVVYWPGEREGEGRPSKTRTEAWLLGGHTPVVMVEGYPGGIALTHVMPTPEADQ